MSFLLSCWWLTIVDYLLNYCWPWYLHCYSIYGVGVLHNLFISECICSTSIWFWYFHFLWRICSDDLTIVHYPISVSSLPSVIYSCSLLMLMEAGCWWFIVYCYSLLEIRAWWYILIIYWICIVDIVDSLCYYWYSTWWCILHSIHYRTNALLMLLFILPRSIASGIVVGYTIAVFCCWWLHCSDPVCCCVFSDFICSICCFYNLWVTLFLDHCWFLMRISDDVCWNSVCYCSAMPWCNCCSYCRTAVEPTLFVGRYRSGREIGEERRGGEMRRKRWRGGHLLFITIWYSVTLLFCCCSVVLMCYIVILLFLMVLFHLVFIEIVVVHSSVVYCCDHCILTCCWPLFKLMHLFWAVMEWR